MEKNVYYVVVKIIDYLDVQDTCPRNVVVMLRNDCKKIIFV